MQVYLGILNGATYTVAPPTTFAIGALPGSTDATRALVVADADGDGWMDVLVGNDGEQNRVYYGNGAGGFKGAGAIGTTQKATLSLVSGDLNNDGNLDAVAGQFGEGAETTLGVSVPTVFDLSAIAEQQAQMSNLSYAGEGGNPKPTVTDLDIIVGDPTYGTPNTNLHGDPESQCRNPNDPYIPVTW